MIYSIKDEVMKMRSILSKVIFASMFAILSSGAFAAGNNVNGVISGNVVDANSAPMGGVSVSANNPANGVTRSTVTNDDGSFSLKVPTGTYNVTTSKGGSTGSTVDNVVATLGSTTSMTLLLGSANQSIEELIVMGSASQFSTDVASTGLNISIGDIELLPVARDIESVALLAPGTVSGDNAFGDDKTLVAFGGSSVAENVYYIDGLNVTNFRNGLGGSSVPFEFYQDFQIKTGGYSAEFGRSTGGVINAVTKRGTNEFEYGIVSYYSPDSLRGNSPDTFFADGSLYDHNVANESDSLVTDIYVGGPIIQDKLFFYALYEFSDDEEVFTSRGSVGDRNFRNIKEDFYGANLFWNINDNHSLSLTHFTDERTRETDIFGDYNIDNNTVGALSSTGFERRGGDNTVIRWDGQITDSFSVSALVGKNEYNLTNQSTADLECPNVINNSAVTGLSFFAGCSGDFLLAEVGADEREAVRIDAEWQLGNHLVRFGLDQETNSTALVSNYPGQGHYYRYFDVVPGTSIGGNSFTFNGTVVRDRVFANGGSFKTEAEALYIEDIWDVTDRLTLSLGLRSESFNNKNAEGGSFVKLDNQIAPRIGMEFDMNGDSSSVIYANWGRYHLPVANNTNARLAGAETFTEEFFVFDGGLDPVTDAPTSIDADGRPSTAQIGTTTILGDGTVPDTRSIVNADIDPMFQDELILGFKKSLNDDWSAGIKYTKREMSSTIDDILLSQTGHYVLTNPGKDISVNDDLDGDGILEPLFFTGAETGFPEAVRTYKGVELELDRAWDGKWSMNASYTWSESKGNFEGLVKSDNGQDDAGLTTDFDFPELQDGAFGLLPNDRTHVLKLRGNYQLTENLLLGANVVYSSGRPINTFGVGHPITNPDYGATYYTLDAATGEYTFRERGSGGETPSTTRVNLRAIYSMEFAGADVDFSLDIFNLLDADSGVEVFENFETDAAGVFDNRYGLVTAYQAPRSIRFGAAFRF